MQLRFLPYHHELITWTQRAAVLVDLGLLWWLWPLILIPEHHGASAAQTITQWWEERRVAQRNARTRRLRWRIWPGCLILVPGVFSLGIAVLPEEGMEGLMTAIVPKSLRHTDPDRAGNGVFRLTVWLLETPGVPFHRNLRLQEQVLVAGEPSAKVIAALRSDEETKRTQALEEVTGLILTNRDLRGADFRETLFAKGDLRGANLKGANLWGARIFAGNLSAFELSKGERCVETTQLSENGLACFTNLQGADLRGAELQGANLVFARLEGADSLSVRLHGGNLFGARLQGADLRYAQLQGWCQDTFSKVASNLSFT
jgi:hypothetical protein